jgi:SPP1 gp7 family putative phage head morphogenesis protein
MQNNIDYWKRRQIREAFNVFSQAEIAADEIAKLYIKASSYMTAKMQGVYDKFKRKYGLTDEQAKQLLAAARDRGSIDAALQALQNGPQTEPVTELRKVVESAAYAARIQQIRELEISAGQVMNAIYKQELAKNTALYQKLIPDSYRRSIFAIQQRAGIAFSFSDVNPKLMDRLLHSKWSGKNYSVRLWGNTQEVAENIKEQIILGVLTGKTEQEMAEALNETFAKGARASRRLIRTESNYIFTQADMAARKECEIRRYMYLATLDMKTCAETCGKLDGRIFLVKDQKPGYNCPPMHPWCRCTTLAILSDEWIRTQTRRARDPETGRTYKVPLSMTYGEWKEKYLNKNSEKSSQDSDIIKLPDEQIFRTLSSRAQNYDILNPETGEYFHFVEGTKIQNRQVFAGYKTKHPLDPNVREGLAEQIGGEPDKWQHCKGCGHINANGEDRLAEVHWFQEESVGKHKFKIKRWLE